MFDVFGSLKSILKTDAAIIDNNVFRLHYKASVIICIAFSLLITSRQYIGDPIDCIQSDDIPHNVIDTYCWIHATFTLPDAHDKIVGEEVAFRGVDKYTPGEKRVYHRYYQWVCFVLFLQAMFFYVPRYLWKTWENGQVKALLMELNCPILSDNAKKEKKILLVDYLFANLNLQTMYFVKFFTCEILNFISVVAQIYFVDIFLGGEFTTYGLDVVKFTEMDQENRRDPMAYVFPKMTKCTFFKYGSSGDIQKHDALCILPLNIVNEKIYVFLWFWMVIVAILSGLVILYRLVIICWPRSRTILLRSQCRLGNRDYVNIVANKLGIGDWFLLYLLGKNMEALNYREVMAEFARRIDGKAAEL